MDTYHNQTEATADKADLGALMVTLDAAPSCLRRDTAGLWILRGKWGYACTWGDHATWQLVLAGEEVTANRWTWAKKRLPFCEVTQDGDSEGVFRLRRLPAPAEAEEIRDILGIRKRIDLSPEELARRQVLGRRLANEKWGCRPDEGNKTGGPVPEPTPKPSL